ncbi:MAG: hypothetical protein IJ797_07880, partial [Selenomonadaceae bacterium]|nr:hypothetical protein [Selenomonadaceae bacterium]
LITDTIELDEESGILYCQVLAKDPNSDNDTPVLYGFTVEGDNILFSNSIGDSGVFTVDDNKGYVLEYNILLEVAQVLN